MKCLTCSELKDRAYVTQITNKLTNHFLSNPCVDCGETRTEILVFSEWNVILDMIAEQTPWAKINAAIQKQDVLCANCHQVRVANTIGPWGVPTKRWQS